MFWKGPIFVIGYVTQTRQFPRWGKNFSQLVKTAIDIGFLWHSYLVCHWFDARYFSGETFKLQTDKQIFNRIQSFMLIETE